MAATMVFVFVLDHLPGDILNKSLETIKITKTETPHFRDCDYHITDPLLQIISRELEVLMMPVWMKNKISNPLVTNKTLSNNNFMKDKDKEGAADDISKKIHDLSQAIERSLETLSDSNKVELSSIEVRDSAEIDENLADARFIFETADTHEAYANLTDTSKKKYFIDQYYDSDEENERHLIDANAPEAKVFPKRPKGAKQGSQELIHDHHEGDETKHIQSETDLRQLTDVEHAIINSKIAEKPSMLVAIFESLSNVTAQTCGGTLLSPHWVVTAASCVNLLGGINATNSTEKSIYTVIVDAKNPLSDGTAHNVTEVHFSAEPKAFSAEDYYSKNDQPFSASSHENSEHYKIDKIECGNKNENSSDVNEENSNSDDEFLVLTKKTYSFNHSKIQKDIHVKNIMTKEFESETERDNLTRKVVDDPTLIKRRSLALMKIDPPAHASELEIVNRTDGHPVEVFGWAMVKEEGHEMLHPVSFDAEMTSPVECAAHYNISGQVDDQLCLVSHDPGYTLVGGQLNWGGPIVSHSGALVGVARGDGGAPLAATPLAPHLAWIRATMRGTATPHNKTTRLE